MGAALLGPRVWLGPKRSPGGCDSRLGLDWLKQGVKRQKG